MSSSPLELVEATSAVTSAGRSVRASLERLRSRVRRLLVVESVGWMIAIAIGAVLVGGMLDYLLRAPAWLRGLGLFGAIGAATLGVRRWLLPALRFRPSLTEVALRLERSSATDARGLKDELAAALELSDDAHVSPGRVVELAPVVDGAARRLGVLESSAVLNPAAARRATAAAGVGGLVLAVMLALAPGLTLTGLARMLWPVGSAEWPKREALADVTDVRVHPLGTALALRASVRSRSAGVGEAAVVDRRAAMARVSASYRLIVDGSPTRGERVVLTSQGRAFGSGASAGMLFERLLEPQTLRPASASAGEQSAAGPAATALRRTVDPRVVELEYRFESADDTTSWTRVKLVEPPAVVGATLRAESPGYMGAAASEPIDLGPGTDERGSPPAVLAGSRLVLDLDFNKALPVDAPAGSGVPSRAWLAQSLGADAAEILSAQAAAGDARVSSSGSRWSLSWRLDSPLRLVVRPVDEFGLSAAEDAVYRLDSQQDAPATVSITLPASDLRVLATSIVELAAEARDDVALTSLSIERQIARARAIGGTGATDTVPEGAAEAIGDAVTAEPASLTRILTTSATLDVGTLNVKPGDEVKIVALARDAFALEGTARAPTRSSVRTLRIISRDELVEQVWKELSGVRRSAIRIDQDQKETRELAGERGERSSRVAQRAQLALTERLARQAEQLGEIRKQIEDAGLTEQTLREAAQGAGEAIDQAGRQSQAAAQSLEQAADAQQPRGEAAPPEDAGKPEREQAQAEQQVVRDELARLIEQLDRGEDAFASKRGIERLLERQRGLRERTEQAGQSTAGKSPEQLSEQERRELGTIAQEQRELAEQARELVRTMQEREQKLRANDPSAAQAMAQASRRAEREQVAQRMEQAGQQAQQNQVGQAQQQQQQAMRSLEQMLQDMDQASRNRDETLRRVLASLIDSIKGLIAVQEQQLEVLETEQTPGAKLASAMESLHQNTLGVTDQAERDSREQRELEAVVSLLEQAATAQTEAIRSLQKSPVAKTDAALHERESLKQLEAAKAAAEKVDQQAEQRQQERKRAELKKKYQELFDQQASVKDGVDGLIGIEATRRTRAAARQLAIDQSAIRAALAELHGATKDLQDAKVFDFAHTRLNGLMDESIRALEAGGADVLVQRRQVSTLRTLKNIIEALDDGKRPDKPFRENEQAGGGGGSGQRPQRLVPPAAELKLLRLMQIETAELTRAGSEPGPDGTSLLDDASALQAELAREAMGLLERVKNEAGGVGGGGGDGGSGGPVIEPGKPEPTGTPRQGEGE
jgi:hypothetical protein